MRSLSQLRPMFQFPFARKITEAVLIKRYKRFLADVRFLDGRVETVHCANSGSMLGCCEPESPVLVSLAVGTSRKLPYSLEAVKVGTTWVGVNTSAPNACVGTLLREQKIPSLSAYTDVRAEFAISKETRLDFRLEGRGLPTAYVEVKNVSLAKGKTARFPDSVTARGAKHMTELAALARAGNRAAVVFFVQRGDCERFEPAGDIDPVYARALQTAVAAGVEIIPLGIGVSPKGLRLRKILPLIS